LRIAIERRQEQQPTPGVQGAAERRRILELANSVWAFSALASACEAGILEELRTPRTTEEIGKRIQAPAEVAGALLDVLAALDLVQFDGNSYVLSTGMSRYISSLGKDILRGELRATELLTVDLVDRFRLPEASKTGWHYTDPALLQSWGRRSVEQVALWTEVLFERLEGLVEALQAPGARFLDVGTGVGRLGIAMCRHFPNLEVVGVDPLEAAIDLARRNIAEAGLSDRFELRAMPVQDLTDEALFELAWVPVMFLSRRSAAEGFGRIFHALRPLGWLIVGAVATKGKGIEPAVLRLMSFLFSGSLVTPEDAAEMMKHAGFDDVQVLPAAEGFANRTIVGRRPTGSPGDERAER
jgi:SAM-dependent methyltransferase